MAGKRQRTELLAEGEESTSTDWSKPTKRAKAAAARSSSVSGPIQDEQDAKSKELHSQVEKRRRDKLVFYINRLADAIPMVMSTAVKPDKLFILKQTVRHVRALREGDSEPSMFLSSAEEWSMILEATAGFSLTLQCSSRRLVEVSNSVYNVLGFSKGAMHMQHLFDFVHRDDMGVVEEQLTPPQMSAFNEESVDDECHDEPAPSALLQRRFYCRMRRSNISAWLSNGASNSEHLPKDSFILCKVTGYFRLRAQSAEWMQEGTPSDDVEFVAMVSCVSLPLEDKKSKDEGSPTYFARCDVAGIFTYVENCVEELIGYSAKELLGKSAYHLVHPDDVLRIMGFHQNLLSSNKQMQSPRYRIRTNFSCWFWCQMTCAPVKNPWSKNVEFFVAKTEIIQAMAPIPMLTTPPLSGQLYSKAPSSSTAFLPPMPTTEFDHQGALADLLALTDSAMRPFTSQSTPQSSHTPPALTPDKLSGFMSEGPSPTDWPPMSASFNQTPPSSDAEPLAFPWAPGLV